ncbi:MAG: helix-turn-helix transcriptional regulator [Bacteroidales bacterium]|jgi:transcriptional regulator with XRE-family HTH domain|nr:helix-turn-helix transcriptional regulator [Bacteroidales bacterium]
MDFDQIRERIKRERRSLGYTQEYMATTLGISVNSYREIESGTTLLVNPRLEEIAKILEKPLENLIFDTASTADYSQKLSIIEREFKERLDIAETAYKIKLAEKEGEINVLKANLETKESIIGVLRERLPEY